MDKAELRACLEIPAALPHVLNLLMIDDEVVLRRLLWTWHNVRNFGSSNELLAALIGATEQLFLKLGRCPFPIDDNRFHLMLMNALARALFDVADALGPAAGRAFTPRLRGLGAQLELQWPRLLLGSPDAYRLSVTRYQSGPGTPGHPADWVRSALRVLGDSDEPTMLPRMAIRRLEWIHPAEWSRALRIPIKDAALLEAAASAPTCGICRGAGLIQCQECHGEGHRSASSATRSFQRAWKKDPDVEACRPCAATGRWMCWMCQGTGLERTDLVLGHVTG